MKELRDHTHSPTDNPPSMLKGLLGPESRVIKQKKEEWGTSVLMAVCSSTHSLRRAVTCSWAGVQQVFQ